MRTDGQTERRDQHYVDSFSMLVHRAKSANKGVLANVKSEQCSQQ
jgi:hypothetical protein